MTGQLISESFEIEQFYPQTVGEFDDLIGTMTLALPEDENLKHEGCVNQLLKGADGYFIQLFGGLNRIKDKMDDDTFQSLSRGISGAFYRLKWGEHKKYYAAMREFDEILKTRVIHKKTASDA